MVAARAAALIGVRFRPHGRDAAGGVDCIGLVALALGRGGDQVPTGYRLRGGTRARLEAGLAAAGLVAGEDARLGDVLLCVAGARQFHLAVAGRGGTIHADAGAGRVLCRPGAVPWPVLSRWREAG